MMSLRPIKPDFTAWRTGSAARRKWVNASFQMLCLATASTAIVILVTLLTSVSVQGWRVLNWHFLVNPPSGDPAKAGIGPAIMGSIWVCLGCALVSLPLGVATAILLEEFPPKNRWVRGFHRFVQLNITNLAGVPSIVYGILGLTAFVNMFGLLGRVDQPAFEFGVKYYYQYLTEGMKVVLVPVSDPDQPPVLSEETVAQYADGTAVDLHIIGEDEEYPTDQAVVDTALFADAEGGPIRKAAWYYVRLPVGRGILAASLTLMLVVLPIVIIASQEALRAVPGSLREGALGLGSTQWQVVSRVTLPAAIPGIMTGAILSMSRAIGEAAPILMIAGIVHITHTPKHLMDDFAVLPIQIFFWSIQPDAAYQHLAAGAIIVLLVVLLAFNALAILIRQWTQKPLG